MKTIGNDKLPLLWKRLADRGTVYLPRQEGPAVLFRPYEEEAAVDLETVCTHVSPKEIFFPGDEPYLRFSRKGKKMEMEPCGDNGAEPAVIFGLRPCDMRAIDLMDQVFLQQDPRDGLYARRRENTTLVALACQETDPFCFCGEFDLNPVQAPGADVLAWRDGDNLVMTAQTPKGEELLSAGGDLLSESKTVNKPVRPESAPFKLNLDGMPEDLAKRFDDPAWEKLYRSCLGCGVCTYICPTCHCFDVQDYGHEEKGERFRCWDSCMNSCFTLMAGGHNPRSSRRERVRQRFLHKLQYMPERYGEFGCVGCGRCLRSCPVNLDIVYAIRLLGGEKHE